ncbi:MAG TPA: S-methyl-5-thioribose-1-phosphate isomerase [Pirellulaceae bacterium]|nr:S-methyl-5-thioribose-1-phosphate isomerase [Pirellulaceae bacterium]
MPTKIETLRWIGDENGHLVLIDQTRLPTELVQRECRDVETVWEAITQLRVRGAPAIGIAAAYGVVLGLQEGAFRSAHAPYGNEAAFYERLAEVTKYLAESRPTAVNLFWALDRMKAKAAALRGTGSTVDIHRALSAEAQAIHAEDREICHAIGRFGAELLSDQAGVLTHCNAGGLATAEYGTALSVLFTCQDQGKKLHVFVDETRPLLQGARLTAWELAQRGIEATLICDNMAGQVMREGKVQAVIVGADRIAANGDTANKIGTYSVAVLAQAHGIPFYVAAPTTTFDLSIVSGDQIPIEQRAGQEITHGFGRQTAPEGIGVYNPAFDVTPARLVKAIITERGVIEPVSRETIANIVGRGPRRE